MATWKGAPTPANTTSTGLGGGSGKFVVAQTIGTIAQQPPSPPFVPAPRASALINTTVGVGI